MARTQINGLLIEDGSVTKDDINISTVNKALIRKLIVSGPLTISSTGVDSGTGDVTIGLNTSQLVTGFNGRTGDVALTNTDITDALGFTPIGGTTGYNGIFTVPTNPPGQQNLQIQDGLIVSVF